MLALMIFESWFVYPIPPVERGDWQPAGLVYEDVQFTSADGTRLHGWFVPHPDAKRAILYCHGNGEQVGDLADLAANLRDTLKASIFLFDYRGYGHSEGRPNEAGCIADGLAAQRWLANRLGIRPDQVVLMGRSLGAGVAVALAADVGAQALVIGNTFPTLPDVAAIHYPWLPVRWLMDNRYDSLSRIREYRGPVFQCHGATDYIVPIQLGRQLFEAIPSGDKRFIEFADRGHNDPWPQSFNSELAKFLDRVETANSAGKPRSE